MTEYIPAWGNAHARLMIIGESPQYNEKRALENNKELYKLLAEVGISSNDIWKSNVSKYYVPPNTKGGRKIPFHIRARNVGYEVDQFITELTTEINSIRPTCILALGSTALWATTGKKEIGNYRGSILWGPGCKVVGTYDPAQLNSYGTAEFKGYWNRALIQFDIKRAIAQSQFAELQRPQRNLEICKSSHQFGEFINRHKNFNKLAVDIEARGKCLPFCIGFAFTPANGITLPLWNIGETESVVKIPDSDMVRLWIMAAELLMNNDIIGQNFKYDQDKLARLGFIIRSLASDTLLKAFAINSEWPKSLGYLTSIYTEEPFYKNEGMYEGKLEDLLLGCARDACVTKEIDLKMDVDLNEMGSREYYENFILHLHQFYLDIENEGFNVNKETRDNLFQKYIEWSEKLSHELYVIVGEYININSPKQVSVLLYENFKIPRRTGTGEDVLTEILNIQSLKLSAEKRRAIEIILEKRRVEKTINTYLAALPDFDGKMRTTYFPCLETGRSSTGQLDPPIRPNIEVIDSKGLKKQKPIGIAFQTITKHGDIGADVRSQYEPDPGYVFLQADSAQAEARVVFLLADDEEALELIDTRDYHALTASWFFGGTELDYSKKTLGYEHPIRFVGKTLRHAGHLGAGKGRAAATVNTDARKFGIDVKITEAFADISLKKFHSKQPKIQKVFHAGIIECLNKNRRILRSAVPFGIQARQASPRQFLERWGDELFRQSFSYIPQRSISDNTKAAGLRLHKREPKLTKIILEAHDGLVFMIPEKEVDYYAPMVKEEMERPLRFDTCSIPRRDLVIPCELEVGYNYMDFKKYKVK